VATGEDLGQTVAAAGLPWLPAGLHPREISEMFPSQDPQYGYRAVRRKVEDLLEISIGQFRPDVIVREPTDLAPSIVSELVGAPSVVFGVARLIPVSSWRELGADRTITRLRREYRLTEDRELASFYRDLYLSVLPEGLDVLAPLPASAVQPLRYVPWDGDTGEWPDEPATEAVCRPRVLVTLGTVYNTHTDLWRRLIDALADEELDVICTLGESVDPSTVGRAPANIHFYSYLPHSRVLQMCDALLCHGGFNTVMGALVAAVPVVCAPIASDQEYNTGFCASRGYGVRLNVADATPQQIRTAVRQVIADPSFSKEVLKFQAQNRRRPGLGTAVSRIEALVDP